jgi:hypothetical protein
VEQTALQLQVRVFELHFKVPEPDEVAQVQAQVQESQVDGQRPTGEVPAYRAGLVPKVHLPTPQSASERQYLAQVPLVPLRLQ